MTWQGTSKPASIFAGLQQGCKRGEPAVAGDDGEFLAVLPDDQRLQQAVGRDRCGQFVDALVLRLADVAFPGGELVERDVGDVSHGYSPCVVG